MVNGVGSIIGGYLSGYLSDKTSASKLGVAGFMFIILTLLIALLSQFVYM
jgi:predicted MFS family arabinose efflux permease